MIQSIFSRFFYIIELVLYSISLAIRFLGFVPRLGTKIWSHFSKNKEYRISEKSHAFFYGAFLEGLTVFVATGCTSLEKKESLELALEIRRENALAYGSADLLDTPEATTVEL